MTLSNSKGYFLDNTGILSISIFINILNIKNGRIFFQILSDVPFYIIKKVIY